MYDVIGPRALVDNMARPMSQRALTASRKTSQNDKRDLPRTTFRRCDRAVSVGGPPKDRRVAKFGRGGRHGDEDGADCAAASSASATCDIRGAYDANDAVAAAVAASASRCPAEWKEGLLVLLAGARRMLPPAAAYEHRPHCLSRNKVALVS